MEYFDIDPAGDRQEVIAQLNEAIHQREITEDEAVNILEFFDLMSKLRDLGADLNAN